MEDNDLANQLADELKKMNNFDKYAEELQKSDEKTRKLGTELTNDLVGKIGRSSLSYIPDITYPLIKDINHAERIYEILMEYIQDFEALLDKDQEIGAHLVSFGRDVIFHIQSIGYHGPDVITFFGETESKEKIQLIQHISQLNVLFVATKKIHEEAKRIGFNLEENQEIIN